jgi:hypothetical protein
MVKLALFLISLIFITCTSEPKSSYPVCQDMSFVNRYLGECQDHCDGIDENCQDLCLNKAIEKYCK